MVSYFNPTRWTLFESWSQDCSMKCQLVRVCCIAAYLSIVCKFCCMTANGGNSSMCQRVGSLQFLCMFFGPHIACLPVMNRDFFSLLFLVLDPTQWYMSFIFSPSNANGLLCAEYTQQCCSAFILEYRIYCSLDYYIYSCVTVAANIILILYQQTMLQSSLHAPKLSGDKFVGSCFMFCLPPMKLLWVCCVGFDGLSTTAFCLHLSKMWKLEHISL